MKMNARRTKSNQKERRASRVIKRQRRASRIQNRAARIRNQRPASRAGGLSKQPVSCFFLRFARDQYFLRFARVLKAALRAAIKS
jgi:hypothetical protein